MKRYGFTIAEVLIALTIIGVISALTMPTFSANTAKSQYITAFKTTINQLESGSKLLKAEDNIDFAGDSSNTSGPDLVKRMLITKLNAKENSNPIPWQISGGLSSGAKPFRVGSSKIVQDTNGDDYYEYQSTGCVESNQWQDSIPSSAPTGGELPCYSKQEPVTMVNSPYHVGILNAILKGAFPINIGSSSSSGNNDRYEDYLLTLPSGVNVAVVKSDNATCRYENAYWDTTDNKYKSPDLTALSSVSASNANLCLAFIDINGSKGPNRITTCGANSNFILSPDNVIGCTMRKQFVNDIFPVFFYDDKVMPANSAAYEVLYGTVNDD